MVEHLKWNSNGGTASAEYLDKTVEVDQPWWNSDSGTGRVGRHWWNSQSRTVIVQR